MIFLFALIFFQKSYSDTDFKQISIENGLAHTDANCISQDSTGLIWIGTYGGLQSYDGYTLRKYSYYHPDQKVYQVHDRIKNMVCDGKRLWISSESGLTCFDLSIRSYVPFHFFSKRQNLLSKVIIYKIFISPTGKYIYFQTDQGLIVTEHNGTTLKELNWQSFSEKRLFSGASDIRFCQGYAYGISNNILLKISLRHGKLSVISKTPIEKFVGTNESIEDFRVFGNSFYIRTSRGYCRITLHNGNVILSSLQMKSFHQLNAQIPEHSRGKMVIDNEGSLWCSLNGGVFMEIRKPFSNKPLLKNYSIRGKRTSLLTEDLLIDTFDNLWVITNSFGVFYRPLTKSLFANVIPMSYNSLGFQQNDIESITGASDGSIYMITELSGLSRFNPLTGDFSSIPLNLNDNHVFWAVRMSRDQRHLYLGGNDGVYIYDLQAMSCNKLSLGKNTYKLNNITDLAEDEHGRLWVATKFRGLFCVETPLKQPKICMELNTHASRKICADKVLVLKCMKNVLFVGTLGGLNKLIFDTNGKLLHISSYQANSNRSNTMSANYIDAIDCINDSVCWIGTIGGGLNKLVLHSTRNNDYTATRYTVQDGLTNNDSEIVLIDKHGNIWNAGFGLSQLEIRTNRIYTYSFADGLNNSIFKSNVSYKSSDGTFYIGGLNGMTYFHPEQLSHQNNNMFLRWTSLIVNDDQVLPLVKYNGKKILSHTIDETSHIFLKYYQNNFSISFAAIGYRLSNQVLYRYRMGGYQNEWQKLNYTNNIVTFSNLPYDTYSLEVQLSTDNGKTWNMPGRLLKISILPPLWLSWWAKIIYLLTIAFIIYISFRQYTRQQNLKRQNEIQKILMEEDEKKYQAKMQFFMNTSHEFKTPLTLIMLSAEKLLSIHHDEKEIKVITNNANNMLRLINELTDIRKFDLGISTLKVSRVDIATLTGKIYEEIKPWADNKNITIAFSSQPDKGIYLNSDKLKIGKMIINLLSNAVKYTNEGGSINISLNTGSTDHLKTAYELKHVEGSVSQGSTCCILKVSDSGIGINADQIGKIYRRFFQTKENSDDKLGSGIGLAIVRSSVLQHKGMITVSSMEGHGSEFIVALPFENGLSLSDNVDDEKTDIASFIKEQYNEFGFGFESNSYVLTENKQLPTLLIVEDNKDLQSLLAAHFSTTYNVRLADNGKMGLDICMEKYPDIIISDVMMPEMDGIEMCSRIKNNFLVSYIPIVLLTAKDNAESQLEGYGSGADLYIPKPFSMKFLEVNMKRLLRQKEDWMKRLNSDSLSHPSTAENDNHSNEDEQTVSPKEEEHIAMVNKLKEIINKNIDNPDLSLDILSQEMGTSRSKLYRDIPRIDGLSISDYVHNVRLETAARLLSTTTKTVQEILYDVGFINSSHFTKIFKLKYGITPTDYRKR